LAQLEMKKKDMEAAKKILLDAIKAIPNEPRIYDQLVNIELMEGNFGQVAHFASRAIKMCPRMGDGTWENLLTQCSSQMAELELESGFPESARQLIEDAIELVFDAPLLYDLLIKIETMCEDMPQAAQVALQGIHYCPSGNVLWYRLAATFLCQDEDIVSAKSVLEQGLNAFPGDEDLLRLKGMI
jgi:tetratricopeptide (TPR) repeat protein